MTESEAARWLAERDDFLLLTHAHPDGDTLSSAAALALGLRAAGKTAYILENEETSDKYRPYVKDFFAPEGYEPQAVVSVDIATEELFPDNALPYRGNVQLCIDHHGSNTNYAHNSCVRPDRAACGEVVYEILMELCGSIDAEIAKQLYIAVSTDTGCFVYGNTTANTLRTAALLIEAGAQNDRLNKILFRTKKTSRILIEAMILDSLEFYHHNQTAVVYVTREMLEKSGEDESALDDIASIPGQIEGVKVGITIKELPENKGCKISVQMCIRDR